MQHSTVLAACPLHKFVSNIVTHSGAGLHVNRICKKLNDKCVIYSLLNKSCPRHTPWICLDYKVIKNIDIQGEERV